MQNIYKIRGIILKRKNIQEADKLLTLLSDVRGKMKVIAKGVRRISSKRAPHLEVFNCVDFTLHRSKNFDFVTEVSIIESFPKIRSDLVKIANTYKVAEVIDKLCNENEESYNIYCLLFSYLSKVGDEDNERINQIVTNLIVNILWELGYLARGKNIPQENLDSFLEEIIENKVKSNTLLTKI